MSFPNFDLDCCSVRHEYSVLQRVFSSLAQSFHLPQVNWRTPAPWPLLPSYLTCKLAFNIPQFVYVGCSQCRKASSLWESWSVSSMDIAQSNINAPPSVWLKWLKHCALQKTLSDTSPPQPPITLMTQVFKPLRGILFKSLSPLSVPLLLPLHFVFLIHLMSQTCFLFMTVDDWGALLRCQLCSRGELSRTRTNKNYHLLRGVRLTLDGMSVWVCVSVCECVYSPLPQGRHLIWAASGG